MGNLPFKVGDSVVVKAGVKDVDLGDDLRGYQGRVVQAPIPEGPGDTIMVRWDSLTLRAMPDAMIEQSMEKGLNWMEYGAGVDEVEWAEPRDTEADVA